MAKTIRFNSNFRIMAQLNSIWNEKHHLHITNSWYVFRVIWFNCQMTRDLLHRWTWNRNDVNSLLHSWASAIEFKTFAGSAKTNNVENLRHKILSVWCLPKAVLCYDRLTIVWQLKPVISNVRLFHNITNANNLNWQNRQQPDVGDRGRTIAGW